MKKLRSLFGSFQKPIFVLGLISDDDFAVLDHCEEGCWI
jgi:hypothetical protein